MNFTRLRTFAARASLPRPDTPVLGRTQNFYRVLGKNFVGCSFTLDSQCGRLWLYQLPATGTHTGVWHPAGNERGPPQRREARFAKQRCPLHPGGLLPGCREAQATARQRLLRPERSLQARVSRQGWKPARAETASLAPFTTARPARDARKSHKQERNGKKRRKRKRKRRRTVTGTVTTEK